uniref:Integrin, alpha 3b n=1 Tax=Erpetoichthys calabaricus TaxID=27687 RepID=A0A8C4SZW2_ERPCA
MMSGNEEQLRMIGKCFVRGNSLNYDEDDDWQIHHYEVCNPGGDLNMEGMCSMGMAAGMTETDVYIGMPGSFNWQGGLPSFKCIPWGPLLSNLDKSNSYIGMSNKHQPSPLVSQNRYTIISGAPRDEHKGAVYLLDSQNELVSNMTLNGQQVGSYFGNSLAATDLNNDGWKDLIVGAPFYFDRKRELGGAAYIFMNEGGNFQATPTLVLNGVSESGFGFAVANIGDVNQDGFQGEYAKETKLGTPKPSNVIDGKDIGTDGIRTFGYSVNGGLDVDENAYPDILVGSLSNKIALLRARPVIQLSKTFTVSPAIVDPDNIKDKLQPIVFALNYSIPESRPKSRRGAIQNLDAFPVLSDTQKNRDTREFYTAFDYNPLYSVKAGRQILQYSPDVKKLYVTVNVTNYPSATKEAEDAHQAILNITLPSALQYSGVRSDKVRCHYEETLLCELGNPFKSLEDRSVQLTYFSGTVMGESAMKTGQDVGSLVEYTFTVTMNSEPLGDKGTLQLELEWPYEIANGKWLLYLMAISTKGTAATRCVPPGEEVNPLNLTVSPPTSTTPPHVLAEKGLSPLLDCSQHTANCIRVHCPLVNMTQEAKVTVRSRVWNSTLLELSLNIDSEIAEEKPYEIELWIIIVAVLAGVLLLGLIILLLWKCGFFKRASRRAMYEAKGQKAEMKIQPSETERLTEDY